MAEFKTLDDIGDVKGKRVLVRVDLNVPMADGKVTDATRIERVAPTILELVRQGREGHPAGAFRPAEGRPDPTNSRLSRSSDATKAVLGRRLPSSSDCIGEAAAKARRRHDRRRHPAAGEHPLPRRRGEERPGLRQGAGRQWRHLRQRRLLRRPPRPCLDRGPGPPPAGLCRAHHAGRARGARSGPRQSEAPGGGHRRRRQGVDQDRSPDEPRQEGRRAGDRRRHGQHLPRRARRAMSASRCASTISPRPRARS